VVAALERRRLAAVGVATHAGAAISSSENISGGSMKPGRST
jgi:hypothetical protein